MHLTVDTDYTLRVMMYLALKHPFGDVVTIDEIAGPCGISRNHLEKIIHERSQAGSIETSRDRTSDARPARAPGKSQGPPTSPVMAW
ncbi:MAG: transcriptional regulator [Paraburkholderia sp.]|uniref:RrF2 family transcriptional regulator n=1 Tax=Paraburkholderia sp. TaxID=1926495 RepID=UPI00120CFA20|nr:Rrf2 family transcriptional regulator [Paraburkholderia sp.]TAL92717.1 MAG: transcriptional regulator [Paraburkholderia sp.]